MSDELDELMDLTGVPGSSESEDEQDTYLAPFEPKEVLSDLENRLKDFEHDYASVRGVSHKQQQMLFELAQITLEAARAAPTQKMVDAFNGIMDKLTSVNDHILKLHESAKKNGGTADAPRTAIQNNYYFTPTEIMEQEGSQYDIEDAAERKNRTR